MKKILKIFLFLMIGLGGINPSNAEDYKCSPTPEDSLGPFYKPNAPNRSSVGSGYLLFGSVRSAFDCSIIAGARIEFWLASPDGKYGDDHRATIQTDESGSYRFTANMPPPYASRPPHIHIRVTAKGFKTLITQHYPKDGMSEGDFQLVLVPQ
jgi:protocatechuate 3,4-dioxygenase beta subunit